MTSQHTPGPWTLTTGADNERIVTSTWDADGLDDDVALVYGGNAADPDVREANARLIAAAPTMYDYIEYVDAKIDIGEVPLRYDEWQQFNASADGAAIRKARGEVTE